MARPTGRLLATIRAIGESVSKVLRLVDAISEAVDKFGALDTQAGGLTGTIPKLDIGGLTADLTAPRAGLADGLIGLRGGVRMTTSSGWRMDAPSVDAATDRSLIRATGRVEAEALVFGLGEDRDATAVQHGGHRRPVGRRRHDDLVARGQPEPM